MTPPEVEELDAMALELYGGHPAARALLELATTGAGEEQVRAAAALTALDPLVPVSEAQRRAMARGDRSAQHLLRAVPRRPPNGGDPDAWEAGDGKAEDLAARSPTRVHTLLEFLALQLPPRRPLLVGAGGAPILREKDTGMVVAARGVGKTWGMNGIALAVSTGGRFLRWKAPEHRGVLLVDGEMPTGTLQDRLRHQLPTVDPQADPDLRILAADVQDEPLPSLASPAGQARIEEHLEGVALVILDNISTLMPTLDENDAAAWGPAQDWLLSLRRRGITTLLAHHAGRAGHARGTSRREDVLDLVIRLVQPSDYTPDQGARFELRFDKARGISGTDAEPFEAWLSGGEWRMADVAGRNREAALELLEQGARPAEVAEALGISRAQAFRHQRDGRKEGRLPDPKTRKARGRVS